MPNKTDTETFPPRHVVSPSGKLVPVYHKQKDLRVGFRKTPHSWYKGSKPPTGPTVYFHGKRRGGSHV